MALSNPENVHFGDSANPLLTNDDGLLSSSFLSSDRHVSNSPDADSLCDPIRKIPRLGRYGFITCFHFWGALYELVGSVLSLLFTYMKTDGQNLSIVLAALITLLESVSIIIAIEIMGNAVVFFTTASDERRRESGSRKSRAQRRVQKLSRNGKALFFLSCLPRFLSLAKLKYGYISLTIITWIIKRAGVEAMFYSIDTILKFAGIILIDIGQLNHEQTVQIWV